MLQYMARMGAVRYGKAIETLSSWMCAFLNVPSPVLPRIHGTRTVPSQPKCSDGHLFDREPGGKGEKKGKGLDEEEATYG
jgi:hypothetical protein